MQEKIETILKTTFSPSHIEVINESHLHSGHQDFPDPGHTHFRIIIKATQLENMPLVKKHKLIYHSLASLFENGLHSIVID